MEVVEVPGEKRQEIMSTENQTLASAKAEVDKLWAELGKIQYKIYVAEVIESKIRGKIILAEVTEE